jgi:uncharacterized protein YhaN
MIIERIHIDRFGALERVSVDGLHAGVEVLHGTNETGKTSLLEFVRGVLFGFGHLFRRGILDPHVSCGGRLQARAGIDARRIIVERRHEGPHLERLSRQDYLSEKDLPVADHLTVSAADGGTATTLFLQDYMGEIDERTFTAVMAFGLDELQELHTLEAEGCGSRLYELASGLDRGRVTRVLESLRVAVERLDSPDPEISPIESLRKRRSDALGRLANMGAPAVAAGALGSELARIDAEIAAHETAFHQAKLSEETIRAVVPVEPLFRAWRNSADHLAQLESTPLIHADLDAWHLATKRRDELLRLAAKRKRIRGRIAREIASHAADETIWKKRAAVAALCDEQPRLERLVAESARAGATARQAARRFGEQLGQAGLVRLLVAEAKPNASADALSEMQLPAGFARSFGGLRGRARELALSARELKAAKATVAEARAAVDSTRGSLKSPLAQSAGTSIATAIEEAAGRAALLRNRIAAGEQVIELEKSLGALDRDVAACLKGQLIPFEWLLGLGAMFVTGAAMILSGLFLPATVTGSLAYAMAALGLVGTGLASVVTWSLDRAASDRLESARQQVAMVRRQRDDAAAQCVLLDKKLDSLKGSVERWPGDHAPLIDRRLVAAQNEVERLEALATREGSLHLLADRLEAAEQDLARAVKRRALARAGWQKALESRALPTNLTPQEVRQLSRHQTALLALDEERQRTSEEARLRREELASMGHQVEELLVECDMLPEGSPLDQLHQLRERLQRETSFHRLRGKMAARLARARRRHREALARVKLANRRVNEVIARWNVETEKEFLPLVDRRPLVEEARLAAQGAERAWIDARRRLADLPELEQWLSGAKHVTLDQRIAEAHLVTVAAREALERARDTRKAAAARADAAAKDHSTEGLQLEIATLEHDLERQLHRRRTLETAREMLESTRAAFARDHQPAVLREASRWLVRLTQGHYTRITTSIHEARLEVHDTHDLSWSPDRLSRGTREQVFLALRLALVRDLERHGVHLPVVIDDALVNFDDSRARAAAEVLMEFVADQPRERQMLVLTCHAHVAAIFRDVGASVRSLSGTDLPQQTQAPVAVAVAEPEIVHVEVRRPERTAPPPSPDAESPRPRVVIQHLAPAPTPARVPSPPVVPEVRPLTFAPRHSLGGLGYPVQGALRMPAHTVIHSGHLAGLGYVGFVTAPSANAVAATLPTSVGTMPVPRVGHGRTSHPHMEMVAGVVPPTPVGDDHTLPHDGDGDDGAERREPASRPAPKGGARGGKRSRGRGA